MNSAIDLLDNQDRGRTHWLLITGHQGWAVNAVSSGGTSIAD